MRTELLRCILSSGLLVLLQRDAVNLVTRQMFIWSSAGAGGGSRWLGQFRCKAGTEATLKAFLAAFSASSQKCQRCLGM